MAYRLDASGSPPDEIRVAARDQLEVAMAGLREAADRRDPGEEIHTARKSLRRFRATLRLIRPHLGAHDYRRAARPARALGRLLSSPRDADVMARTVRGLIDDVRGPSPDPHTEAVAHALEERRRSEWAALSADTWLATGAPASLVAVEEQVDGWALDGLDWRSLLDGVARSYRRAREASSVAQRTGSSDALHEARKRAKDLRYQLDLLRAVWEPMMAGQEIGARTLTESIGTLRDLEGLRSILAAGDVDPRGSAALADELDDRITALHERVTLVASLLYAEEPDAVARRMRAYAPRTSVGAT